MTDLLDEAIAVRLRELRTATAGVVDLVVREHEGRWHFGDGALVEKLIRNQAGGYGVVFNSKAELAAWMAGYIAARRDYS